MTGSGVKESALPVPEDADARRLRTKTTQDERQEAKQGDIRAIINSSRRACSQLHNCSCVIAEGHAHGRVGVETGTQRKRGATLEASVSVWLQQNKQNLLNSSHAGGRLLRTVHGVVPSTAWGVPSTVLARRP